MLSDHDLKFCTEIKYFLAILLTFACLFSLAIITAYIFLYSARYWAIFLPVEKQSQFIEKVDFYIDRLDEFLETFRY